MHNKHFKKYPWLPRVIYLVCYSRITLDSMIYLAELSHHLVILFERLILIRLFIDIFLMHLFS